MNIESNYLRLKRIFLRFKHQEVPQQGYLDMIDTMVLDIDAAADALNRQDIRPRLQELHSARLKIKKSEVDLQKHIGDVLSLSGVILNSLGILETEDPS